MKIATCLGWMVISLMLYAYTVHAQEIRTKPRDLRAAITLDNSYILGVGDSLRISTFAEPELTNEFEVNSEGEISFPLIGEIKASGLSVVEFKDALVAALQDGYLVNPQVSIELLELRPFYITGEVSEPGSYEFVAGMTVINAVILAGGYTRRANQKTIEVRRRVGDDTKKLDLKEDSPIFPGDTIRVKERFF